MKLPVRRHSFARRTSPKTIRSKPPAAEERFGPIDVWVNDAMTSVFSPIKEMTANHSGLRRNRPAGEKPVAG